MDVEKLVFCTVLASKKGDLEFRAILHWKIRQKKNCFHDCIVGKYMFCFIGKLFTFFLVKYNIYIIMLEQFDVSLRILGICTLSAVAELNSPYPWLCWLGMLRGIRYQHLSLLVFYTSQHVPLYLYSTLFCKVQYLYFAYIYLQSHRQKYPIFPWPYLLTKISNAINLNDLYITQFTKQAAYKWLKTK